MSLPRRSLDPNDTHTDHADNQPSPRAARLSAGLATGLVAFVAAATTVALLPATPADAATAPTAAVQTRAQGTPWPGHPDRAIVRHKVRSGDTATGLAVRYHAWTDELMRLNHLGSGSTLRRGQVLRIPVVLSAVRRAGGQAPQLARQGRRHKSHPRKQVRTLIHRHTPPTRKWRHYKMTRTQVRRLVAAMARHYDVPPRLALAIAWQESGWQQRRVSSAGAIGVMQVMPDTGRWMRWYAGRPLRLRDTHDNVRAGVLTLRVLRSWTKYDKNAIAAYYQGFGAVKRHGHFKDTKRYVASVRAHQRSLKRTGSPR